MKSRLQKVLETLESMRDQASAKMSLCRWIDNAGESDAAQERADKNSTIVDYLESAIGEIENAIAELE